MRPNVLLIVLDTARADAFSPYSTSALTPTVAQLADGALGSAHPSMFSTACWTVPAHASLFTGQLPRSAGMGHTGGGTPQLFKKAMAQVGDDTLPGALNRAGYDTAGVSANPWVSAATGFDQGFRQFELLKSDRNPKLASKAWKDRIRWYAAAVSARADDGALAVERLLGEWLDGRGRDPFFWFVNLMECHSPYLPPRAYSPVGPLGRLRAARDASRHCTLDAIWTVNCGGWDIDDAAMARMRAMYEASIRQLDDWLARILDRLDRARVLEDTQVLLTSDHGENFGEGKHFGHAFSLDNRLLHVPFISSGPVSLGLGNVASLADVPGALARALDVEESIAEREPQWTDVAVAQLDAAAARDDDPRIDTALEFMGLGDAARRILRMSLTCATDGRLKLIRDGNDEWLFDLVTDPLEEHALEVDGAIELRHADQLARLRRALDDAGAQERVTAVVDPGAAPDAEVASLEEQMRLLGYL